MRMKELYERLTGEQPKDPAPLDHDLIQESDQTRCRRCGRVWDTNDPAPPPCEPRK